MNTPPNPAKTVNGFAQHFVTLRNRHFVALDLLIFCATPVLAVWLRTEGIDNLSGWDFVLRFADALALYALVAAMLRLAVFVPFGLYARYWRYASIDELGQIILAVATSTLLVVLVFFGVLRPFTVRTFGVGPGDLPRTLPFIDGILVLLAVGGVRYSVRLAERMRQRRRSRTTSSTRVVVIGAGDAGAMIVKEMQANPQLGLDPIGFLDDDARKHGVYICGVQVIGDRNRIPEMVERYQVQQAVIAMPTASGRTIRELARLCQEANIPVKTVPGIFELLDGSVTVNQLRPVDIEDLLRREPVATDMTAVLRLLKGKRVLVTGAGGSIGNELCRQIARHDPAMLVLLGHGENSLFYMTNELRRTYPQLAPQTVVADIRDLERMKGVFARHQPQVVFHAAAHKHVPLMEENVEDAVSNNVLGTRCLLTCAEAHNVERLVLISTDKAVNPTSIMGATKRVAELLVQESAARTRRSFVAVRFGNVLCSRGSVVPVFKQQIARGGPITVTHPEVRRYFMTIPEAVELVLQAATLGKGGEIFVLDMGKPIKIVDLARDLIRLSGLEEGHDIDIVFTGLRPGEKMFEELFVSGEDYAQTCHEKILVARGEFEIQNSETCPEFDEGFEIQKPVLSLTKDSKSPISNLQSAICYPPSAICHQPSAIHR